MEIILKTEVGLSQDAEELWGCEGVQGRHRNIWLGK